MLYEVITISGCPFNQTVPVDPDMCTRTIYPVIPTATDNCSVASVTYAATGATIFNGTEFPNQLTFNVGLTTVTYSVSDGTNTTSCSYNVTILDDINPTIACVGDQYETTDPGYCYYTVSGTEFDPTDYSDNCPNVTVSNDFNFSSSLAGAQFPKGVTPRITSYNVCYTKLLRPQSAFLADPPKQVLHPAVDAGHFVDQLDQGIGP